MAQVEQCSSYFLYPVLSSSDRSESILLTMYSSCLIHLQDLHQINKTASPLFSALPASPAGHEPGCRLLILGCWTPGDRGSFQQAVNSFAASRGHAISLAGALCCFLQHCTWLTVFPHQWIFKLLLFFAQILARICHYFMDYFFFSVIDTLPLTGAQIHSLH